MVFYFNLIILKSKITFYKVGFIICLYSFNEVAFQCVFELPGQNLARGYESSSFCPFQALEWQ